MGAINVSKVAAMQFLSNQVIEFLGQFVVGLAGVVVGAAGIWITLKLRDRKELAYEIISNVPAFTIQPSVQGEIEVLFKGKPVTSLSEVILKIWNSGNKAIDEDAYRVPVSIRFGQGAEVKDARIRSTHPERIRSHAEDSLNWTAEHVQLNKLALNKGQGLELETILSNCGEIEVGGHLVEVEIRQKSRKIRRYLKYVKYLAGFLGFLLAVGFLALLSNLLVYTDQEFHSPIRIMFYAAMFGLACTFVFSRLFRIHNRWLASLAWLVLTLSTYGVVAILANK